MVARPSPRATHPGESECITSDASDYGTLHGRLDWWGHCLSEAVARLGEQQARLENTVMSLRPEIGPADVLAVDGMQVSAEAQSDSGRLSTLHLNLENTEESERSIGAKSGSQTSQASGNAKNASGGRWTNKVASEFFTADTFEAHPKRPRRKRNYGQEHSQNSITRSNSTFATTSPRQSLEAFPQVISKVFAFKRQRQSDIDGKAAVQRVAMMIVGHPLFDALCGLLIMASSLLVGAEVEYMAHNRETHEAFFVIQSCFNVFFLGELMVRIFSQGMFDFFYQSPDFKMNYFDFFMVVTSFLDLVVELMAFQELGTTGRTLRGIRLLRVFRTLRITRELRHFRDFRKMLYALQASFGTFFWSLLLLIFTMYSFAICFTLGTSEHMKEYEPLADEASLIATRELFHHFGTLPRSFYSLFMAMSNGISWGLLATPLQQLHWIFVGLFITFISLIIFGVLNVVTSVFIEAAMKSTEHYKDLLMSEQEREKEIKIKHIRSVFHQMDEDSSGEITLEEMEFFLEDEDLRKYLEALNVSPNDTRMLFKLIDADDNGAVDISEFCEGCLKLRGAAKNIDIHCVLYESRRMVSKFSESIKYLERRFEEIHKHLANFETKSVGSMCPGGLGRVSKRTSGTSSTNMSNPAKTSSSKTDAFHDTDNVRANSQEAVEEIDDSGGITIIAV